MHHEDMIRFLHGEPLEEEKEDRVLAELATSEPDAMLQVTRRIHDTSLKLAYCAGPVLGKKEPADRSIEP